MIKRVDRLEKKLAEAKEESAEKEVEAPTDAAVEAPVDAAVEAPTDAAVEAPTDAAALVKIDEKHADPVPLENYGDALHEFDFDSDKRLSIYEWRYVPWPRRAYHSDEGHERG